MLKKIKRQVKKYEKYLLEAPGDDEGGEDENPTTSTEQWEVKPETQKQKDIKKTDSEWEVKPKEGMDDDAGDEEDDNEGEEGGDSEWDVKPKEEVGDDSGEEESSDDESQQDANEETAEDADSEEESVKKFSMYKQFIYLMDSIKYFNEKLKGVVKDRPEANTVIKIVTENLLKLQNNMYDFMVLKYKASSYTQVIYYFETAISSIKLNFELLRNNGIVIKH